MLALAGCQAAPADGTQAERFDDGTRRVIVNYLIAHGMAESYLMSGRATPAGLVDLVRSDHAALIAIRSQARSPSWGALIQADGAVRGLIDVTTRLDRTVPRRSRTAASR